VKSNQNRFVSNFVKKHRRVERKFRTFIGVKVVTAKVNRKWNDVYSHGFLSVACKTREVRMALGGEWAESGSLILLRWILIGCLTERGEETRCNQRLNIAALCNRSILSVVMAVYVGLDLGGGDGMIARIRSLNLDPLLWLIKGWVLCSSAAVSPRPPAERKPQSDHCFSSLLVKRTQLHGVILERPRKRRVWDLEVPLVSGRVETLLFQQIHYPGNFT